MSGWSKRDGILTNELLIICLPFPFIIVYEYVMRSRLFIYIQGTKAIHVHKKSTSLIEMKAS